TGNPPRTAVVEYFPLFPNPHSAKISNSFLAASSAVIQLDGSYRLVVLPGPGVVCVAASPRYSYAVAAISDNDLTNLPIKKSDRGGCRSLSTAIGARGQGPLDENKYNALSLINPDERAEFAALDLMVQTGGTLQGTIVGPDCQPLS